MISYYIHKLIQTAASLKLAILLPGTTWKNWVINYTPKKFVFNNHVVLGFWDKKLMHFGDHLFHLGLIRSLVSEGIKVTVAGDVPLKPIFKRLNINFIKPQDLKNVSGALVISKDDIFFKHLRLNRKNAFLGINYRFTKSKKRIGEIIFNETKNSLNSFGVPIEMNENHWSTEGLIPEGARPFDIPTNSILYNDFVASGALSAYQRLTFILNLGRTTAEKGFKIVYVGNPREKKQRIAPHFISKDLRGETLVSELFSLTQNPNVKGIITYDTLWAHVGNIAGKKVHVVGKQERGQNAIWKRFVPMSKYISSDIETY
jgi:hypothetical protein